ncbi:MAG: hypothetical protein IPL63_12205 [Saprospiraceae bacterium]|nr:hypothetical protein [Saprospiraceae bacterium]
MFKIGLAPPVLIPSALESCPQFCEKLENKGETIEGGHIEVFLFGSLSLTGKGHATDLAVIMGLSDFDPETVETSKIDEFIKWLKNKTSLIKINTRWFLIRNSHTFSRYYFLILR